jgi:DNA-binding SARP family transcriptional activator/TolB-like protein
MRRPTDPAETEAPAGLLFSLLGSVRVGFGGMDIAFPKRKARALLAYLALTEGHQDTRERLGGLLWSEVNEVRARTSLRQELHQINEKLRRAGSRGLQRERERGRVALLDPVGAVDVNTILAMAGDGTIHPLLVQESLISDSFLRDIDDVDPSFAIWARARRQTFHDQLLVSLERILRGEDQDRAERRRCAQAILNLDPTHEEACRVFMRLSAEAGDPMAAQRAYNALYKLLDKEYDAEPGPETIALIALIKQGVVVAVPDPSGAGSPRGLGEAGREIAPAAGDDTPRTRTTLLVEPFGMNGIAPDNQHLVEGFRHELLVCLVQFREWSVVAAATPADRVDGSGLADAYALAATAYRAGGVISMVLTLRDQKNGLHLWGDRYTLTLDHWFDAQQDVVRKIADALNVEVSAARLRRVAGQPDLSQAAHDLWLRGQAAMQGFRRERWDTARRMFLAAIELAPDFGRFHCGLAQIVFTAHMIHPGQMLTEAVKQQALTLASRAVALDAMDARSQLALGWSLTLAGRFQAASVHLALARELSPNDVWVTLSATLCRAFAGDLALAARVTEQLWQVSIAPSRLHWAYQALIAFIAGDHARAAAAAERAHDILPPVIGWQAAALALSGQIKPAKAAAARCIEIARAEWASEEAPTLGAIGRWLLSMFAFARTSDWMRLRDGLAAAGIPDGGATFRGMAG